MPTSDLHGFRAIARSQNTGDIATLARYKLECRVVNAREIGRTLIALNLYCVALGKGNRALRRRIALSQALKLPLSDKDYDAHDRFLEEKRRTARFIPTPPADTFAEVKTEARTPRPFRTNHHD